MAVLNPALAPPPVARRPRVLMVATGFVMAGVAMFFASLFGIYLLERSTMLADGSKWLPEGVSIPLTQPNMLLLTLIMASVCMQWAHSAIRDDSRTYAYLALGITLLLGFAFLNQASYLYNVMGFKIEASTTAVLVYAITGAHIVMLVIAMAFVALMAIRALGGQFSSTQSDGIAAATMFWHANTAVFFLIWLIIYVTK